MWHTADGAFPAAALRIFFQTGVLSSCCDANEWYASTQHQLTADDHNNDSRDGTPLHGLIVEPPHFGEAACAAAL